MSTPTSILERYPAYRVDIGIEVHVQLTTQSKIFCTCPTFKTDMPNAHICSICAGYPGTLPVLNKKVVEYAVMAGLATNCSISQQSTFARKHYFYPDLPKGYQITQSWPPICTQGWVEIKTADGSLKKIRIMRIHMEEDAGKNIHASTHESFVDLNRAGTPLLEIVTEPDISSTHEARAYLKELHTIVRYLGICSGNMEEGAFRADTNISVRKKDAAKLGTKVELKNINSFKFIADAIEHEIERQIEMLESGERIIQQTRLWDTKHHKTVAMRSKEEAADYRYFDDPDLPILHCSQDYIQNIKSHLPELPRARHERLCAQGLTEYEAEILIDDPELADYYEQARSYTASRHLINWLLRDVLGYIKEAKISLHDFKIQPQQLAELVQLLDSDQINSRSAREIFEIMCIQGGSAQAIMKERGLEQVGSSEELETMIKEIIASSPEQVADYKSGKHKLFGYFVGVAMQKSGGKGNPKIIQELLKKYLS